MNLNGLLDLIIKGFISNCICYFFIIGIDIKADEDEIFIK